MAAVLNKNICFRISVVLISNHCFISMLLCPYPPLQKNTPSATLPELCSLGYLKRQQMIGLIPGGGGGTPYKDLYGEAPPERATFFRRQVYKRVGISQAEVYKRVGKLAI